MTTGQAFQLCLRGRELEISPVALKDGRYVPAPEGSKRIAASPAREKLEAIATRWEQAGKAKLNRGDA